MNKTIIIAEAGVNHNGSIDTAKQLVNVAVDAGVDYIKFQTFKAGNLVSANAAKAEYQKQNTQNADETQLAMLKQLELSYEEQLALGLDANGNPLPEKCYEIIIRKPERKRLSIKEIEAMGIELKKDENAKIKIK